MLVAEALTAAIGLFAYKEATGPDGKALKETAVDVETSFKRNTARLTYAFGEGVRAFREALATHEEDVAIDGDAEETRALPKKNSRRSVPDAATSL
jgi:hypothetical protein